MAKIVIVAGGTGGHIVPAKLLADHFVAQGHDVICVGTTGALERRLFHSHKLYCLNVTGLRGKSKLATLKGLWRMACGWLRSLVWLRKWQPDVVLCMGGYVTVPVAMAAKHKNIPVVLHEQNSIAGLSNKFLAKFAKKVLTAFPDVFAQQVHAELVGNPLRPGIIQLNSAPHAQDSLNILVLGGSQGAQHINSVCMDVFTAQEWIGCRFWHQTGRQDFARVNECYGPHNTAIRCIEFIDDMAEAYAWADVVISRAGAMSVAEIGAAGLAALFVPFPYAVDDHQYTNAMFLAAQDAAFVCRQKAFTKEFLANKLGAWQQQPSELVNVGAKARQVTPRDAIAKIAQRCLELCG